MHRMLTVHALEIPKEVKFFSRGWFIIKMVCLVFLPLKNGNLHDSRFALLWRTYADQRLPIDLKFRLVLRYLCINL